MDNPTVTSECARKVVGWSVDIPVGDGETIANVIASQSPAGAAIFTTSKPSDKDWNVHLSVRIEEVAKT